MRVYSLCLRVRLGYVCDVSTWGASWASRRRSFSLVCRRKPDRRPQLALPLRRARTPTPPTLLRLQPEVGPLRTPVKARPTETDDRFTCPKVCQVFRDDYKNYQNAKSFAGIESKLNYLIREGKHERRKKFVGARETGKVSKLRARTLLKIGDWNAERCFRSGSIVQSNQGEYRESRINSDLDKADKLSPNESTKMNALRITRHVQIRSLIYSSRIR
jgi:hypothetical protein